MRPTSKRRAAGSTTASRLRAARSDDQSALLNAFSLSEGLQKLRAVISASATTSTSKNRSSAETPPVRQKGQSNRPGRDDFKRV